MRTRILSTLLLSAFLATIAPTPSSAQIHEEKFAEVAMAMASAASAAYEISPLTRLAVDGIVHTHVYNFGNCVDVYSAYRPPATREGLGRGLISYVIAFRGTQTANRDLWGDVARDITGATLLRRPLNPWTGVTEPGRVGSGFHTRVANFMNFNNLRQRLLADSQNNVVIVHTTGHSLGAVTSQLFSYYGARWARSNNRRVYFRNFPFNTPRNGNGDFALSFLNEIRTDWFLQAWNFTRRRDPISEWKAPYMEGPIHNPNRTADDIIVSNRSVNIGYCAHKEFEPLRNRPASPVNHNLLLMRASLQLDDWTTHKRCMSKSYYTLHDWWQIASGSFAPASSRSPK